VVIAGSDNHELEIGPGLITKRQGIAISLLVEGDDFSLSCQNSLADVTVRKRRSPLPFANAGFVSGAAATLIASGVVFTLLAVLAGNGANVTGTTETVPPNTSNVNAILAAVVSLTTQRIFLMLMWLAFLFALLALGIAIQLRRSAHSWWS
jgi:hypothetical protein